METGRGAVVSLLVENGHLRPGHYLVAGTAYGQSERHKISVVKPLKMPVKYAINMTGFKEIA